jgi:hypothetical protein
LMAFREKNDPLPEKFRRNFETEQQQKCNDATIMHHV